MSPETVMLIEKLGTPAAQVGMLALFVYYLATTLRRQYEARITALELRSDKCEDDRRRMHEEIRMIQQDRIGALERVLGNLHEGEG
ncbi:MAG: hypothetical protein RJB12_948 [Pseudomonadota bacterium]|jgi:hypothetical protein